MKARIDRFREGHKNDLLGKNVGDKTYQEILVELK